jgi:hypothetical protein
VAGELGALAWLGCRQDLEAVAAAWVASSAALGAADDRYCAALV